MFEVNVNGRKQRYHSKPTMGVDISGSSASIPKPLTYDSMPEGYPSKGVEAVTLMEEQEVAFADSGNDAMIANSPVDLDIKLGDELTVIWDGVSYDAIVTTVQDVLVFGNLRMIGVSVTTNYPFLYVGPGLTSSPMFAAADTATSHTIKVTATKMVYNTIDVNMLPKAGEDYGVVKKDEIVTAYVFPRLAPQVEMNKAVDDFMAGKAKITWDSNNIISAFRSSDTEIIMRSSNDPVNSYRYTADEITHAYSKTGAVALEQSEISVRRIYIKTEDGKHYAGPITGVNNPNAAGDEYIEYGYTRIYEDGIAIKSSDSSKMFKITVDDSGTISATEVT